MPLETVPDCFDDAVHQELDRMVNEAAESDGVASVMSTQLGRFYLLTLIVRRSNGELDQKYSDTEAAKALINTHEELQEMLSSAWERKSYREIRNISILKSPGSMTDRNLHQNLSGPFEAKYIGAAVDGFYEYLMQNEKLFRTTNCPRYYAKFCSVVQSSGTGKSRMLTELSKKDVIVIYMNLRGEDEKLGFPPRDPIPSNILTQHYPTSEEAYKTICRAFFIALFDAIEECLATTYTTRNVKAGIMRWASEMCDMSNPPRTNARHDFFTKLYEKYTKLHADLLRMPRKCISETTETPIIPDNNEADLGTTDGGVDGTVNELKKLSLSAKANIRSNAEIDLNVALRNSYTKMAASLERIFPEHFNRPKLVIAVDEAHPLTPKLHEYRPADVFCRVVKEYSDCDEGKHAVWVVFASTTSKVADFSPPNKIHNSDRVATLGEKLFPPYTQLGWDQCAPALGDVDVENVSQMEHIVCYGRPLWLSLKSALTFPDNVLDTAAVKLCGEKQFNARKTDQVLAILGQRFGLKITFGHPDSVQHLENGVASHLLICLATTLDRNWRFTSYPSEPLLSCVAAKHLHEHPGSLGDALTTLLNVVNGGMIDIGQRGELASRLLWLLAKDLFIRTRKHVSTPSTWDAHLVDCEMIPVVDWLEFVFGSQVWEEGNTQGSLARTMFENVYLNFSHWVCMDANIAGSKVGKELPLNELTLRHWQRTSAVQCCHQQPRVDKIIPIYFKDTSGTTSAKSRMSQIFISDKARKSKSSETALSFITRRDKGITSENSGPDSMSHPYIAILADLGRPPSFSVTYPEREVDDRCLRIYAAGVDTATFPFLAKYPALLGTLQNLVLLQQIPETERAYTEYLDAQVRFGSTAMAEHMFWEHGRNVPNLRTKDA